MFKELDREEFIKVMNKKVSDMFTEKFWELVPRGETITPYSKERSLRHKK